MRLLVIRHGESEADILNVHEGRADFELTERGHRQADAMAKYISTHYKVETIYSSPLKRAYQTATHLSSETGLPIITDDNMMEFNNGLIAGLSHEEADARYPLHRSLSLHEAIYEQESTLEFRFRAEFMFSKIISESQQDSTIALVTHGGFINQFCRALMRLPVDSDIVFPTGDTGFHEFVIDKNIRRIIHMNCTFHASGL